MERLINYFMDHTNMYRWYASELENKFEELVPGSKTIAKQVIESFHPAYTIFYRDEIAEQLIKISKSQK